MTDDSVQERHRRGMQRRKEHLDARIARADQDCGVLVLNTGNGNVRPIAASRSTVLHSLVDELAYENK